MLDALAAVSKALLYAGLLSGGGAVFAQASLRASGHSMQYLTGVMARGAWLTAAVCPLGALILILRLGGQFDEATLAAVFLTSSGAAICLQLTGAALLLTTLADQSSGGMMRLSHAALAVSSFIFSGHAASAGPTQGLVAFLHVAAAAWWIGSLWYLRYACAQRDLAAVAEAVRRFSALAFVLVGALVLLGLVLVMALVDFSRDPWLSGYGQILALKLTVVAVALGLATSNRLRLAPRVQAGDVAAVALLRRTVNLELWLIAAVLATTAILTTYVSPHE